MIDIPNHTHSQWLQELRMTESLLVEYQKYLGMDGKLNNRMKDLLGELRFVISHHENMLEKDIEADTL